MSTSGKDPSLMDGIAMCAVIWHVRPRLLQSRNHTGPLGHSLRIRCRGGFSASIIAAISLLFCPSFILNAEADELSTQAEAAPLEREVEVVIGGPSEGKTYPVDVGLLPTDRPVSLALRIINHSAEALDFDSVGAVAVNVELFKGAIQPGDSNVLRVTLDTTVKQPRQVMTRLVKIYNSRDSNHMLIFVLKGSLQAYLGFAEPYVTVNVSQKQAKSDVSVRFLASEPVVADVVSVEQQPHLGDYRIEPVKGVDNAWDLVISVPSADVPPSGLVSKLVIEDLVTVRRSECTVVLRHHSLATINPLSTRLMHNPDQKEFKGSCVLTIPRAEESPIPSPSVAEASRQRPTAAALPLVSATLAGKRVSIDVKPMNDEHFRIVVKISADTIDKLLSETEAKNLQLDWEISSKQGAWQMSTPVIVMK
jgi:hypothetical protein